MPENFRERFLKEAGERPYAWAATMGLPKDLVTAVIRGGEDYQPIRRTLTKLAEATGKSVAWWQTGEEGESSGLPAKAAQPPAKSLAGTIAGGTGQVNVLQLELAIKAVDKWEQTRDAKIDPERRPAVIAVLYEFLSKSENAGDAAIDVVLRALG
ncbi:hypothetical protein GTP44_01160 [Duganella sp. FT50W]|uniref:Uncharacterized protein n=1 Tax=Duganella lactea TaxID=2692173 RepID=A0A6L8MMR0_9BURK|nr:hypothetical protein [Duganella lactea]MYM80568.1 hypothetical protein [Duganella lactea]